VDSPTGIFTFAERVPANISRGAGSGPSAIYFPLYRGELEHLELLSASLGLYLRRAPQRRRDAMTGRDIRASSLIAVTVMVSKVNSAGGLEHYAKKKVHVPHDNLEFSQWVEINLLSLVNTWVDQPGSNYGLVVQVAVQNREQFQLVTFQPGTASHKPYLELTVRERRSPRARRTTLETPRIDCDERGVDKLCCRYPLVVNFDSFGWDWIIAPRQYAAFFCAGDCPFAYINTNINYVTQQAQTTTVKAGGGPCCTPRDLSPISLLYYDANMRIIRGFLPEMVVNRCSCT